MKIRQSSLFLILMLFGSLLAACGPAAGGADARAWIDQPSTNGLLPLAPFTLKAHASRPGGGIINIVFLVNAASVGGVSTNPAEAIVSAELEWRPSAPGEYFIQAQAFTADGNSISAGARVCVSAAVTEPLAGFLGACDDSQQPSLLMPPTSTPRPAACTGTVRESLTVRTGPGTVYSVLRYLDADELVDVVGVSADGSWLAVKPRDGAWQGWVSAKAIALNCDPVALPLLVSPPTPTPTDEPPTPTPEPLTPVPFDCGATYGGVSASCSSDNRCTFNVVKKLCENR